jgi:signal transduction histidine kinase
VRRSKTGAATRAGQESRGNFTPPSLGTATAGLPAGDSGNGSRLAVRNWRVRTRLNAILLIPVIVGLVFGGFRVQDSVETWNEADEAQRTAELVRAAATYGNALIDERDRTAAPLLAGRRNDPAVERVRAVTDRAKEGFDRAVTAMPDKPGLKRRLAVFRKEEPKLGELRRAAYTDRLSGVRTEEGYVTIQHPLMEFANELGFGTGNITSYGRTVYSISLGKAAQSLERSIAMHILVRPGPSKEDRKRQFTALTSYAYLERIAMEEYVGGGRPEDIALLEREKARAEAKGKKLAAAQKAKVQAAGGQYIPPPPAEKAIPAIVSGAGARALKAKGITAKSWFASSTSKFDAYRAVEKQLADQAVEETEQISSDARQDAFVNALIVLVSLLLAFVVAGMMARSMSRGMRNLRTAAFGIAEERLPSLVDQLSRTDPGRVDTRVAPIPIDSRDEIGEVARAFDQVHREAVRLAAEQALLRGNVNAIFTNLSSRNQGLIERQLGLISDLENNEADPDQLESLFRLDHLATRMRRNGENLLVLAGEEPGRRWNEPVPLVDILRAASSEVEHYERIELSGIPESEIHGQVVNDLVHLLAELLENATTFSSPQTKVHVTATRLPDGRVVVEIHDKGIGLTAEDFADINHKLANPPTVDASLAKRMGLFVVGRLADRHGIRVQLRPSGEQAGTTCLVMLPEAITRGGGGEEDAFEDFSVSRIMPEHPRPPRQRHGELTGSRSAAELGFDDGSYEIPDDVSALDPVRPSLPGGGHDDLGERPGRHRSGPGESLGERPDERPGGDPRPLRPAPSGYGQQPYGRPEFGGRQADSGWPGRYGQHEPPEPGGPGTGPSAGDRYVPEEPQAESAPGVHGNGSNGVGFDRPGPGPSDYRSTTGAGLPRRETARQGQAGGPKAQHEEPQRQTESSGSWHSANDERWNRAGRLREPQSGGTTSSGLPRRVPRANLVEGTAEAPMQGGPAVSRAPEDVRGRLSNLHRGVRRGRGAGDGPHNDRQGFGPGSTYDQER